MLLPKELRQLVHDSVELLGTAIRDEYGEETYRRVEETRKRMKRFVPAQMQLFIRA